jgi:hypothetical protein
MIRLLSINRLATKTNLVGRITVFENKIKSKLKGQAIGFSQSRYSKRLSAITYKLNFPKVLEKPKPIFLYE